jgi:hypothetical protein
MSFVDQSDAPGAGRIGLGLLAACLWPLSAVASGYGEGFLFGLIAIPQIIILFLPLALWLLPKTPFPILVAVALGTVTEPLSPMLLRFGFGDYDWNIALSLAGVGAVGGFLFWAAVVAGNPYFSDEARRDRAAR